MLGDIQDPVCYEMPSRLDAVDAFLKEWRIGQVHSEDGDIIGMGL